MGTSTSFESNIGQRDQTDQQSYYEFSSTVKPRLDYQVIGMRNINESTYTQNIETIPRNTEEYELTNRYESITAAPNNDSLKFCFNSKVAPEMRNLLSALVPETKRNYDNSVICAFIKI